MNMPLLNYEAYKLLCKVNSDATDIVRDIAVKNWYELTYDLFRNAPLDNINDFWKIVAYTYSWMPTIPDIKAQLIKEPDQLLDRLQRLKNGDDSCLPELIELLIPVINSSLVGVSKVLHFIAPEIVPIIDRNVLSGWEVFFFILHPHNGVPKLPYYKTALNSKHIPRYIQYRNLVLQWKANCEGLITVRDLEIALFQLGREQSPEHFRIYNTTP